ncbi:hypothetical protein [Kribbella qitaiheensis]|uniref:hypothetical protein n=1 Tax=Kribbella qitaiheensis TaxID=1544730 RepID=UPI001FE42CE7|nr:hypothetical protein [Kribbella qitaiheensis]
MASRLVRRTAIAAGIALVAGLGLGFAAGKPVDPTDILPARQLPADLCARLGDVSSLLPKASNGAAPKLVKTGSTAIRCSVKADEAAQTTYSSATLEVLITPYGGKDAGAGNPPLKPDQVARQTFDRRAMKPDPDRSTAKLETRSGAGGESWTATVVEVHADVIVQVDYTAQPIAQAAAKSAALVIADRAIWESQ